MNTATKQKKQKDDWLAVWFIHLLIELNFEVQMVQATNIIMFYLFSSLFVCVCLFELYVLLYTGNKYNYKYCDTSTTSRSSCGSSIYTKQQKNSNKCNKRFSSSLPLFSFIMSTNCTIYNDKIPVCNTVIQANNPYLFLYSQIIERQTWRILAAPYP